MSGRFDSSQTGYNKVKATAGKTYGEYLELDRLLSAQTLQSEKNGYPVQDEHLFIVTHQVYELWFKQILFDLDYIRRLFITPVLEETETLRIVSALDRIVRIFKIMVDQVLVLETMSPLEFIEFRKYLSPASGFQSLQFRLLENKLGLKASSRVPYNACYYQEVFKTEDRQKLLISETTPSLLQLVEKWLERTPGLLCTEFNFWERYTEGVQRYLQDLKVELKQKTDPEATHEADAEWEKIKKAFDSVTDPNIHRSLQDKGERRLSHLAMQGALMISFYRDMPRFSQPYQILTYLMDIDSLMTKWRYNHVMLVQRMLGSKVGTGGSSGYMYLRSTISDRYKVFLDFFNLSTWLLPRAYIPILSPRLARKLSVMESDDDRELVRVTPDPSDISSDDDSANAYII